MTHPIEAQAIVAAASRIDEMACAKAPEPVRATVGDRLDGLDQVIDALATTVGALTSHLTPVLALGPTAGAVTLDPPADDSPVGRRIFEATDAVDRLRRHLVDVIGQVQL